MARKGVTTPIAAEAGEENEAEIATPAAADDAVESVAGSSGGGGGASAAAMAMAKDGRNKKDASLQGSS